MENQTKLICSASYYNFKKGFEYCKNQDKCSLFHKDYYGAISKQNSEFTTFRFQDIKDFRACKRFLPKDSVPF